MRSAAASLSSRAGRCRLIHWVLAIALAPAYCVFLPGAAVAQSASAETSQPYAIPAGSLARALNRFADVSQLQLIYSGDATRGLQTKGLNGVYTRRQALAQLLAGSGLSYRFTDDNTATIERPGAPRTIGAVAQGTIPLDTIDVQGTNQSPYGPGVGYIATRTTSGSKTDTPLIEIPQSISVVTRQQMDDRNVQNLNDVLRYTAGVQAGDTGDLTTESFAIRGYNSPYLSLYRDGLRAMFRAFDNVTEPYGLDRVEVLKGPASVLYGQGIPGGVVNLVTKRPTENRFGEVQLQGGTFNRRQAAIDFGGPGQDPTFLYRFTALLRDSDTQIDYVPDDRVYVAPAFTFRSPNKDTTLTVLLNYQKDRTSFPDGVPAFGTVLPNPNGTIPINRFTGEPGWSKFSRSSHSIAYILDHRFNDVVSVHQTTRYDNSEYDRNQIQNRWLEPDMRTIARRARQGHQESSRIQTDTRAQFKFGADVVKHTVIAGIDYSHAQFKTRLNQGNIAGLDIFSPIYGAPVSTPNALFDDAERASYTGVYLQDQIKLWDRLIVVAGIRRDWAKDTLVDHLANTTTTQKDAANTHRVGVIYQAPHGIAPYASYTQSFVPVPGTDAHGQLFKPETGEQHEVGVKFQPPGTDSFITVSAYKLVRQNVLTPYIDPTNPGNLDFLIQTGEITTKGLEFEAVSNVTKELSLVGTYTANNTKVTGSNDIDLGKRPTTVPNYMASFWANYAFKSGSLEGFSLGAGARTIGSTPGDMANTFFVPAYTLMDAAIRYDFKGYRFSINANNLFDKHFISTCFSTDSCYFGRRRSVIATVAYRW
jgi:iron complex outermembrane receptor protein